MSASNQVEISLGLRQNWKQFFLLVLVTAFVGGMVGLERTILPDLAASEFGIAAKASILSFIVVFGLTKAATNYFTGTLANRLGRRRLLIWGWILSLPIPFILIWAPSWYWVVGANVLLGIHQGFCWSSTVVMKIDLVGEKDRGLAMGLNEAAGYLAVGLVAFLTGWIANQYGVRPYPFYLGIALAVAGLLTTWLLIRDTRSHASLEAEETKLQRLPGLFWQTTWKHPNLGSITQAGLVNNLNDGMVWGLLPLLLGGKGFSLDKIGLIVAIYPVVWGISQLFTGKMADHLAAKKMLFWGMLAQGVVLTGFPLAFESWQFMALSCFLGLGTAVVYPTFLSAIAQNLHPNQRAEGVGIFRLWRDLGYAIGALLSGVLADFFGISVSIYCIGGLTLLSALIILMRMKNTVILVPQQKT